MNEPYCPPELLEAARNGDEPAAEELVRRNQGLIHSVARRFFGRGAEPDDLIQLGSLGFLKALRDYDGAYGTAFSTYAVPKIAGEIRRFLRDDGAVKVSRTLREQAAAIAAARSRLEQTLWRSPTVSELSREVGLSPEEIASAELAAQKPDSLQRPVGDDGQPLEAVLSDAEQETRMLENLSLRQAVFALPDVQRRLIVLRYFRGMTQQATARVLGISQVQVSRTEKKAVLRLRELLSEDG